MEKFNSIDELFIHELHDLHSAEEQLLPALTKMAAAADAPELRGSFARHLEQTRQHLRRVKQAMSKLGHEPNGVVCHGIEGLITESEELMGETVYGPVLDGALINAARKVEHYEITAYRSAISRARELGFTEVASLLDFNLQEEELADFRLQQLAEGMMPYSGRGLDPRDDYRLRTITVGSQAQA